MEEPVSACLAPSQDVGRLKGGSLPWGRCTLTEQREVSALQKQPRSRWQPLRSEETGAF